MAILKTVMDEDVLSKSQRHIIRHIYRMAQLAEAIIALDKVTNTISGSQTGNPDSEKVADIRDYLVSQIGQYVMSTKIPNAASKN